MDKKIYEESNIEGLLSNTIKVQAGLALKERILSRSYDVWKEEADAALGRFTWMRLVACVAISFFLVILTNGIIDESSFIGREERVNAEKIQREGLYVLFEGKGLDSPDWGASKPLMSNSFW